MADTYTNQHPGTCVVPLLKEIGRWRYKVVGTGFFFTRYGALLTAAHVLEEMTEGYSSAGQVPIKNYVLQMTFMEKEPKVIRRRLIRYVISKECDIAVAFADNFGDAEKALVNLSPPLSTNLPHVGAKLVTFAYPENRLIDFDGDETPSIKCDYFPGELLEHVEKGPALPYSHMRTSIEMLDGASGGPVFWNGKVIGINCRGWNFGGGEFEGQHLSSVVPIAHAMGIEMGTFNMPRYSWEYRQLPARKRDSITLGQLGALGAFPLEWYPGQELV